VHVGLLDASQLLAWLDRDWDWVAHHPSAGKLRLGDEQVTWRSSALEHLAYAKGALWAFRLQAQLGGADLFDFLRPLFRSGAPLDLALLRKALEDRGLADFYAHTIDAPDVDAGLADALKSAGFEPKAEPIEVADLGLRTGDRRVIDAVDPAGPAGHAGVHVGDRIVGFVRTLHARVDGPTAATYPFGMDLFDPARTVALDLDRRGAPLHVELTPVRRPGGVVHRWVLASPERFAAFFGRGR
jgi:predicted metalloprotease with PDZ domain